MVVEQEKGGGVEGRRVGICKVEKKIKKINKKWLIELPRYSSMNIVDSLKGSPTGLRQEEKSSL